MRIHVSPDVEAMAVAAAEHAERVLVQAIDTGGGARVIAATGNSQLAFLRRLTASRRVDWSSVELFHLDEYVGISEDHPASFRRVLREHLVGPTGITRFHALDGDGDIEAVRQAVGAELRRAPIDVAFVGIGENTHLAFNDPPADFETREPYLVVALDEACRRQQVGEGWFPSLADVPTRALSMSIHQILEAREILTIVPDERKAAAVAAVLSGPITPDVPASALRTHPNVTLYLDAASASRTDPQALRSTSSPRPV